MNSVFRLAGAMATVGIALLMVMIVFAGISEMTSQNNNIEFSDN